MSELKCKRCDGELDCMGGCSAHRSNWYCPACDRPKETRSEDEADRIERKAKEQGDE